MVGLRTFLKAFLLIFFLLALEAQASEIVRVRLETASGNIKLSGMMLRFPGRPSSADMGFQSIEVSFKRLRPRFYKWTVVERNTGELLAQFNSQTFEISGSMMRAGFKSVPDRLSIRPQSASTFNLIATMDLEEYLRGVLPAEMPASWPVEALKAQAIAARTFALFRKTERERAKASYHLESDVMDQMFKHGAEDLSEAHRANVDRAIRETSGIVLRDVRSRPIAAYFHADCGGHTEDAKAVWGTASTGSTVDSSCPTRSLWRAILSREAITAKLSALGYKVGRKLTALEAVSKNVSGRVEMLKAIWGDGSETKISGHAFRMGMGFDLVKSTKFDLEMLGSGEIALKGSGYGHGVGLCQWGARAMATMGKKHEQILAHYYPNAVLGTITR